MQSNARLESRRRQITSDNGWVSGKPRAFHVQGRVREADDNDRRSAARHTILAIGPTAGEGGTGPAAPHAERSLRLFGAG